MNVKGQTKKYLVDKIEYLYDLVVDKDKMYPVGHCEDSGFSEEQD